MTQTSIITTKLPTGIEVRPCKNGGTALRISFMYRGICCRETLDNLTATKSNIKYAAQREWLDNAKRLVRHEHNSLIPQDTSYITYLKRFYKATERAGINKKHGLRHKYAHMIYKDITGWDCPAAGGPTNATYSKEQISLDKAARLQLSNLLGHSRRSISRNYCGQ